MNIDSLHYKINARSKSAMYVVSSLEKMENDKQVVIKNMIHFPNPFS